MVSHVPGDIRFGKVRDHEVPAAELVRDEARYRLQRHLANFAEPVKVVGEIDAAAHRCVVPEPKLQPASEYFLAARAPVYIFPALGILQHDPGSKAADAYRRLAEEIIRVS